MQRRRDSRETLQQAVWVNSSAVCDRAAEDVINGSHFESHVLLLLLLGNGDFMEGGLS